MKLRKRILSCLLSLTIAASALGAQAYADYGSTGENAANEECNYNEVIENRNEAAYYDISAAINYAKIYHTKATNDTGLYYGNNGGDCAYFVSRCLSNGGINVNFTTVQQFLNPVLTGFTQYSLYSTKNGIPTGGQNAGKISQGDVLVYSCACGNPHVALVGDCSGSTVKVYSHTPAMGPDCQYESAQYYVCKNGHGIYNGNGGAEVLHYSGESQPNPVPSTDITADDVKSMVQTGLDAVAAFNNGTPISEFVKEYTNNFSENLCGYFAYGHCVNHSTLGQKIRLKKVSYCTDGVVEFLKKDLGTFHLTWGLKHSSEPKYSEKYYYDKLANSEFAGSDRNIVVDREYQPEKGDIMILGGSNDDGSLNGKFSHVGIVVSSTEYCDATKNKNTQKMVVRTYGISNESRIVGFFHFNTTKHIEWGASSVSNITDTSAKVSIKGKILDPNVTGYGLQLSTDGYNFPYSYSIKYSADWSLTLTGYGTPSDLTPGKLYYYRFYVAFGGTKSYSPVSSFRTTGTEPSSVSLYNISSTSVNETSAYLSASCSYSGERPTKVGVKLSTDGNNFTVKASDTISHNANPFNIWYDNSEISGLTPGTKYYYKFYAEQNGSIIESAVGTFITTRVNSTVSFSGMSASSVTSNSAYLSASCSYSGSRPSKVGVMLCASGSSYYDAASDSITHYKNPFDIWYNNSEISGLSAGTTYYYKFYAVVDGSYQYSNVATFTTLGGGNLGITFSNIRASDITQNDVRLDASCGYTTRPSKVGVMLCERGGNYYEAASDYIDHNKNPFDIWYVNNEIAGLKPGTTYCYKFYAVVSGSTVYSDVCEFTTAKPYLASVTLSSSAGTNTKPTTFSWTSSQYATGYDLCVSKETNGAYSAYNTVYDLTSLSYSMQLAPGNYEAYVNVKNSFDTVASNAVRFTVQPTDIGTVTVAAIDPQTYTGSEIVPFLNVSDGTKALKIGVDYNAVYSNNIDVGTATVTLTGIGNYTKTKAVTFKITAKNLSGVSVTSIANQEYIGSAIIPECYLLNSDVVLTEEKDYTAAYSNNTNVGTATVTFTGKGNYTGTKTATFKIVARSIANCTVSAIAEQTYTGSALTPPVTVKDGTKTLTKGTDYTVSYSNNINAGTATVTITGKGNYTGTKTATFTIKAAVPVVTATPGDAQVTLKWNAVPDADKYAAYIVNADGTLKALATKLTGTTYTAAKLTNGTTYKFLVRAYVDNSWSKYTDKDIVAATPISTRPEIIEATAGDSEVALTWTTVDGAEKYAVYCVDAAGSTKCLSSRLKTASYTAKKLTNGKAYKFYVRAYVNGTWSKFTAANMVQRTPVCLRPSVKAEAGDAQVTLTWSAINGAEKYAAYTVGSDGTLKALSTRLETTEYTAKKLTNGTKYKFLVRAYVNGKWTPYDSTNMVTCTPVSSKPVVKATAGNGQVTLNWGKVTGALKYAVYVVNSDNTLKCLTSKLTANTYTVKNLVNGKTYKYVVRAYVNGAWSKYTTADYVSATPKA